MDNNEPMSLPDLEIEELFYLEASCAPIIPIGDVGGRILNIFPIIGGFFRGEKLNGEVADLGADWNYMMTPSLAEMDTRYLLKTDDGAYISISSKGRCGLTPEQYEMLEEGRFVDPETFYFRQHIFFATSSEKYQWLNGIVAFAIMGIKDPNTICYKAYMLK
ncbi:MAG: DUF3237 domain-containing protein [Clostridiales bacterium]|nr:DUF3237 domain-containing protein [Clostridiales bacterium]